MCRPRGLCRLLPVSCCVEVQRGVLNFMQEASDLELIADPATDQEMPWLTHPAAWTVQDALGEVPAEDVAGQLGSLLESKGVGS